MEKKRKKGKNSKEEVRIDEHTERATHTKTEEEKKKERCRKNDEKFVQELIEWSVYKVLENGLKY